MTDAENNLFEQALICLLIDDPDRKASCAQALNRRWRDSELDTVSHDHPVAIPTPGRPQRPHLVDPRKVPKRGFNSPQGLLRLAHAIAHIEFNAINLALDAVYRFREMPDAFYSDWLQVAAEESSHFLMLVDYLNASGVAYGDYDAHNGLWEMALKTDHDVMVRMALVPRVLEARGLDVTPEMIRRLEGMGAKEDADALRIIYREEIGHVAAGTRWFRHLAHSRGTAPDELWRTLVRRHFKGVLKQPFNDEARRSAGFDADWYAPLADEAAVPESLHS